MQDHFRTFALYNAWANERLYSACGTLDDASYYADRKAFFKSIHGTLNHLLLCDRIWFGRMVGHYFPVVGLNQILYADRHELRRAREAEDARIIEITGTIDRARLDSDLDYRTTSGEPQRTPMTQVLGHVFNHQTHHRGQVHDMLSQAGVKPPPIDLLVFIRTR